MSAGRGGEIGLNRYGVSLDVIKHLSSRSIDTFRPLSGQWHAFLGLVSSRATGQKRGAHTRSTSTSVSDERQHDEGRVALMMHNNGIHGWGGMLEKCRSGGSITFGTSSGSWFFGSEATQTVEQARRSRVISEEEVKQAMGKVLGTDDVSFRSATQRDALHAVVSKDDLMPHVIVLLTGGGKSMLFMAPACLDDPGVTVVVVPYRALLDNLLSTAKKAGIDCIEWQPGEVNAAALVLFSADKVGPFMRYAGVLGEKGLLRRVFVDESHLTFTSSNWRPKLTAVREVRGLRVPTIMLTATLPIVLEFELEASMAAQMARYIRVATTQMRTRYVVDLRPAGKGMERTMEVCGRMLKHLGTQKGVVYSRGRKQCEQLAKELKCAYDHAEAVDNQERLDMWLRRGGLIVATSALGTGVNFPGIVFVLHVDMPYGMIDFAQELGRAGRGGEDVYSIIVVEEGRVEQLQGSKRGGLEVDQRTMGELITTRGCRRRVMGGYLDGQESDCTAAGTMAQCDRCGAGLTELERGRVWAARERQMVEETLDEVVEGCVSCFVGSGDDPRVTWEHKRDSCKRYPVGKVLGDEAFRRNIRFEAGSDNCFGCGFSQKVCRTGIRLSEGCQWPGVMGGLLVGMVKSEVGVVVLQQKHELLRDEVRAVAREVATWRLFSSTDAFELTRQGQQALPYLPIHRDGLRCQLQPQQCQYIARSDTSMRNHWRQAHRWNVSHYRGQLGHTEKEEYRQRRADALSSVCCQRLFPAGKNSGYFEVSLGDTEASQAEAEGEPTSLASIVRGELAVLEEAQHERAQVFRAFESAKEVSPWLELTRWPEYLEGHRLRDVVKLTAPPSTESEPVLSTICGSLERLVTEAHRSVCNDSVNVFDQARINSFLQRPRAADRPLMVKLQKSTWRAYTKIWKSLLCFVYRTSRPHPQYLYRHQLTTQQTRVNTKALGQSISVAAYREIAIAISRQWVRGDSAVQRDHEEESVEAQIDRIDSNAADEQATHSPHVARLICARDVMELVGSSADRRRRFRKVSEDWHRWLGFESTAIKDEKQGPFKAQVVWV
ncbi:hypothetical protein LTR12_016055 [Friedmanniomyces endolithicus]|nr:hypothetical protein LTR12_016055 [Friedmanniomyces endolithicus]